MNMLITFRHAVNIPEVIKLSTTGPIDSIGEKLNNLKDVSTLLAIQALIKNFLGGLTSNFDPSASPCECKKIKDMVVNGGNDNNSITYQQFKAMYAN